MPGLVQPVHWSHYGLYAEYDGSTRIQAPFPPGELRFVQQFAEEARLFDELRHPCVQLWQGFRRPLGDLGQSVVRLAAAFNRGPPSCACLWASRHWCCAPDAPWTPLLPLSCSLRT